MHFEEQLDRYLTEKMATDHIPGISLAVMQQGELLLSKGYGLANVELNVPATPATVYEIASITKVFTATAIMMLAEEGKLQLADPVPSYRSGLRDEWQTITIRHLLTHTSGLPYWSVDWDNEQLTTEEFCRNVFERPFESEPGTQFTYNDMNFNVLGMVIHTVTGKPVEALLQERIFDPLGMNATQANNWRAIVPQRAAGYRWHEEALQNSLGVHWHPQSNVAADVPVNGANGCLLSTVEDFAKLDAALYTDAILPQATLQAMWQPNLLADGTSTVQGLGWQIYEAGDFYPSPRVAAHGGGNGSFTTHYCRDLEAQVSIALFTNLGFATPWDLCRDVLKLYKQ